MDLSTANRDLEGLDAVSASPVVGSGWAGSTIEADDRSHADQLVELSKLCSAADRERLLLSIAELCRNEAACAKPALQQVLQGVFMELVATAEQAIRRRLAEVLADVPWAPRILIIALARDDIEIARPVIAQSSVLTHHDLVQLLVEATVEHQIEVARRPQLSGEVAQAIVDRAEPDVLAALAGNTTAELAPADVSRLVDLSERVAALRSPLARHPMLTSALAIVMYGWVGEHLRTALVERFHIDGADLGRAIDDTLEEIGGQAIAPRPLRTQPTSSGPQPDRLEMETRVVQKLQAAGQLRPGLLIRSLRDDKLALFTTALAALGGFTLDQVNSFINADTPDRLAQACTAVGVDHSAFATLLSLVRGLNHGRPGGAVPDGGASA